MKKDRNAFFQNQSASTYFYPSNPVPNVNMGYPMATESSSNFYQGPVAAGPMNTGMVGSDYSSELESRLSKIERQIARLDTRLTKLESEIATGSGPTTDYGSNNMYVI